MLAVYSPWCVTVSDIWIGNDTRHIQPWPRLAMLNAASVSRGLISNQNGSINSGWLCLTKRCPYSSNLHFIQLAQHTVICFKGPTSNEKERITLTLAQLQGVLLYSNRHTCCVRNISLWRSIQPGKTTVQSAKTFYCWASVGFVFKVSSGTAPSKIKKKIRTLCTALQPWLTGRTISTSRCLRESPQNKGRKGKFSHRNLLSKWNKRWWWRKQWQETNEWTMWRWKQTLVVKGGEKLWGDPAEKGGARGPQDQRGRRQC